MDVDDDGFTVIELMIAMMILLVIMTPLATSFVIGLGTTRGSEQDASNSADAQLLASFLDADVASAETVSESSACGGASTILGLTWRDGSATTHVAYRTLTNPSRQARLTLTTPVYQLERVVCASVTGPVLEDDIVARTLAGIPDVTCDGSTTCPALPRRVTLTAQAYSTQLSDISSTSRYTFGVTASRRVRP